MAFLTLHELLPLAFDYAGQKQAVKAVFVGMAVMSARFVDVSAQRTARWPRFLLAYMLPCNNN